MAKKKQNPIIWHTIVGKIFKLQENLLYLNPKVQQERFYGKKDK